MLSRRKSQRHDGGVKRSHSSTDSNRGKNHGDRVQERIVTGCLSIGWLCYKRAIDQSSAPEHQGDRRRKPTDDPGDGYGIVRDARVRRRCGESARGSIISQRFSGQGTMTSKAALTPMSMPGLSERCPASSTTGICIFL